MHKNNIKYLITRLERVIELINSGEYHMAVAKNEMESLILELRKECFNAGMEEAAKICDRRQSIESDLCAALIRKAKDKS